MCDFTSKYTIFFRLYSVASFDGNTLYQTSQRSCWQNCVIAGYDSRPKGHDLAIYILWF